MQIAYANFCKLHANFLMNFSNLVANNTLGNSQKVAIVMYYIPLQCHQCWLKIT